MWVGNLGECLNKEVAPFHFTISPFTTIEVLINSKILSLIVLLLLIVLYSTLYSWSIFREGGGSSVYRWKGGCVGQLYFCWMRKVLLCFNQPHAHMRSNTKSGKAVDFPALGSSCSVLWVFYGFFLFAAAYTWETHVENSYTCNAAVLQNWQSAVHLKQIQSPGFQNKTLCNYLVVLKKPIFSMSVQWLMAVISHKSGLAGESALLLLWMATSWVSALVF